MEALHSPAAHQLRGSATILEAATYCDQARHAASNCGPARAVPGAGRPNAGRSRSRATVACAWHPNAYPTRLKSRSRHLAAVRPVTARAYRARQEASIVASSTRLGSKSTSIRSSTRVTTSGTPSIASR